MLRCYQRDIARFIHVQMEEHYWEEADGYEVKISKGFTELKHSAYSAVAGEQPLDFRHSPDDKSNMSKYLFDGFQRGLLSPLKFDSDAERKLAVILDRDALKWFKPAKGQFQIFYRSGADHLRISTRLCRRDRRYDLHAGAEGQQPDGRRGRSGQERGRCAMVPPGIRVRGQLQRQAVAVRSAPARRNRREYDVASTSDTVRHRNLNRHP